MNKQQTTTAPAGFTVRDWKKYHEGVDVAGDGYAEEKSWGIHDGPRVGNVGSSWAPDRGFNLEVEPCGIDNLIVGDLTPRQARTLASRLLEVADRIEELQADEVRDAARAIASKKGDGTITDLARAADRLGVKVTTMYAAWEAAWAELGGQR